MLTILLELDGVMFPPSRLELVPEPALNRVVEFLTTLGPVRCPNHGEPSGVAHVDVRAMSCVLEEPCCADFAEALKTFA